MHWTGEFARTGVDEVHELHEGLALELFLENPFERVGEVAVEGAELELFEEKGRAVQNSDVSEKRKGFHGEG